MLLDDWRAKRHTRAKNKKSLQIKDLQGFSGGNGVRLNIIRRNPIKYKLPNRNNNLQTFIVQSDSTQFDQIRLQFDSCFDSQKTGDWNS